MSTYAQMFGTIRDWNPWSRAGHSTRGADAEGKHTTADDYRACRDARTVDPLHIPRTTTELIESLHAGRFDTITEARHRGASWEQIGEALHQRSDAVRCE
ncbi:hypothetical protein [Pseudonocardia sp. H11422]|uniref:hypothetical protein n=1 Tax=Pseudonocardia sp. H11422 TaxID=2835866 RepID=UPI001BDC1936|nr:hypothetical protein [Pseudonocardia sp. H11422]